MPARISLERLLPRLAGVIAEAAEMTSGLLAYGRVPADQRGGRRRRAGDLGIPAVRSGLFRYRGDAAAKHPETG